MRTCWHAGASGSDLLRPSGHRPHEQAQADLMTIRIRAALVEARHQPGDAARGFTKAMGDALRPATPTAVEKLEVCRRAGSHAAAAAEQIEA